MRAAFGPLIPTDPPAIALWLTKSAIDTRHDDLVTDLQEWLDPTDLSIPAHHVAELGLLANDLHGWHRDLVADGHPQHATAMADARTAVITALGDMARSHELLANQTPAATGQDLLLHLEDANLRARNILREAGNRLDHALLRHDEPTRRRAEAAHRGAGVGRTSAATTRTTTPTTRRADPLATTTAPGARRSRTT
ncbi:hypothetical protein [Kitasatospora sp. NPDC059599]|uniref:hypothetical protein n=1 Tax=Kitasatospora sp. NPDC059599 TaxID=3346880 RepID=UPI0036A00C1E